MKFAQNSLLSRWTHAQGFWPSMEVCALCCVCCVCEHICTSHGLNVELMADQNGLVLCSSVWALGWSSVFRHLAGI